MTKVSPTLQAIEDSVQKLYTELGRTDSTFLEATLPLQASFQELGLGNTHKEILHVLLATAIRLSEGSRAVTFDTIESAQNLTTLPTPTLRITAYLNDTIPPRSRAWTTLGDLPFDEGTLDSLRAIVKGSIKVSAAKFGIASYLGRPVITGPDAEFALESKIRSFGKEGQAFMNMHRLIYEGGHVRISSLMRTHRGKDATSMTIETRTAFQIASATPGQPIEYRFNYDSQVKSKRKTPEEQLELLKYRVFARLNKFNKTFKEAGLAQAVKLVDIRLLPDEFGTKKEPHVAAATIVIMTADDLRNGIQFGSIKVKPGRREDIQ